MKENKRCDTEKDVLTQLSENIPVLLVLASPDWSKIYYANRGFERIWGRPLEDLYEDPTLWIDTIPDDDIREKIQKAIQKIRSDGYEGLTGNYFEYPITRQNGDVRWISAQSYPVTNSKGQTDRIAVIVTDITEQKQHETALRESEAQYRSIYNSISDCFIIADLKGTIVEANPSASRTYGYTREELIGLHATDLIRADYHSSFQKFAEEILLKGSYTDETIDIKKDGTQFYTEVKGTLFMYKGTPHLAAVIRDVTERKKTENLLKEQELLYRSLFENNQSIMLLIHPDTGEILDANPAACSFYGYSQKYILKMNISDINCISKKELLLEMQKAKSEQRNYFNFKHRLSTGEIRDVEVYSGPVIIRGKNRLCSIIHDISERMMAQKERERLIDELTKALDEIKTLRGIVPICSHCKKIRDDEGYWNRIESYIQKHSRARFSHGLCPACQDELYGDKEWYQKMKQKRQQKSS